MNLYRSDQLNRVVNEQEKPVTRKRKNSSARNSETNVGGKVDLGRKLCALETAVLEVITELNAQPRHEDEQQHQISPFPDGRLNESSGRNEEEWGWTGTDGNEQEPTDEEDQEEEEEREQAGSGGNIEIPQSNKEVPQPNEEGPQNFQQRPVQVYVRKKKKEMPQSNEEVPQNFQQKPVQASKLVDNVPVAPRTRIQHVGRSIYGRVYVQPDWYSPATNK